MKKKLVVVGGGSSAHTLIPLLSESDMEVSILTSKPLQWSREVLLKYIDPNTLTLVRTFKGSIVGASDIPADLIPQADYIVFCMPVHQYLSALFQIAPYIDKDRKVAIGTVYGQAGFNWMADEMISRYNLTNVSYFAFGLIPWICRIEKYGKVGITYGFKTHNYAAVYPYEDFEMVNNDLLSAVTFNILGTGKVHQSDNFISLTLSVDNQIIHPARCYGLYLSSDNGQWKNKEDVPMFYRDFDERSAEILSRIDNDYTAIREKIKQSYPNKDFSYMLDYLSLEHFSYSTSSENIRLSFVNSPTLTAIETPVVFSDGYWMLDKGGRFFKDDIYFGLCVAKRIADIFEICTPMIDKIIYWAQSFLGLSKLELPKIYEKLTINNIVD